MSGSVISMQEFRNAASFMGEEPHERAMENESDVIQGLVIDYLNMALAEVRLKGLDIEEAAETILVNGAIGLHKCGWGIDSITGLAEQEVEYYKAITEEDE
ncbi:MAG: hypothetical protein VXA46_05445 [Aquiluna sp.]